MPAERFTIHIPDARLDELRRRLRATQWPGDFGNADWRYGVEQGWLREMADYWANDFDWRAQEAEINRFPHFRTEIDGVPIHFIHLRSGRPDAIPIILTHGWPWTFWDWQALIAPLAEGDAPAFDVIVPSLPGVAFSEPLRVPGLNVRAIARLWVKLMHDVLGYRRFAAAGGDWGAIITSELGHAHPEQLLGIHITLTIFPEINHLAVPEEAFAPDERWMMARNHEALPSIISHSAVHGTDPQTLAYALADSPVGTAAWIWERRRAWSDCGGDIVGYQGRDFLCTTASLYWLTNTIGSSMRIYNEQFFGSAGGFNMNWPWLDDRQPLIPVPTGVAVAPKEVVLLPRAVVAERTNLQRYTLMDKGGHFLPSETPAAMVEEYRAFFGSLA